MELPRPSVQSHLLIFVSALLPTVLIVKQSPQNSFAIANHLDLMSETTPVYKNILLALQVISFSGFGWFDPTPLFENIIVDGKLTCACN